MGKTAIIRFKRGEVTVLPDNRDWTNRFQIKSGSSDRVYTIAQNKAKEHWACDCPGWVRHRNCKHLRAIGLPCFEVPYQATLDFGR